MVLAVMSLTAYSCGFDFRWSSLTYMLYLMYYRAGRCYSQVNWSILDGLNRNITLQPDMPTETDAVFRTLIFSVIYLVLSIFLAITCLLALSESLELIKIRKHRRLLIDSIFSRRSTHWQIKAPDFLAVLCTVHFRFCFHHCHGSAGRWFLPLRLLCLPRG